MRILVLTTSYPVHAGSSAGHFVETEAKLLASAGNEVTVCAPGPEAVQEREGLRLVTLGGEDLFTEPGALERLRQHPSLAFQGLSFGAKARRWLKQNGPFDAVQAHWLLPCAWPIAVGLSNSLEVVCHGSDVELLQRLPQVVKKRILEQLLHSGACFRFVSAELREKLCSALPSIRALSMVEPCAIDTTHAPTRVQARELMGLAADQRCAIIMGRLIESKRVEVGLAALEKFPELKVVVIGDGPLRAALERRFPRALFTGQLPRAEALRWLAAADILISASEREGAPTVIREARQLDVPVISAVAGDLAAWAETDEQIHLFRSENELVGSISALVGQARPLEQQPTG